MILRSERLISSLLSTDLSVSLADWYSLSITHSEFSRTVNLACFAYRQWNRTWTTNRTRRTFPEHLLVVACDQHDLPVSPSSWTRWTRSSHLSRSNLTSPKWKNFRGSRIECQDKIRLNNAIWRIWHQQCKLNVLIIHSLSLSPIDKRNMKTVVCQFVSPLNAQTSAVRSSADRSLFISFVADSVDSTVEAIDHQDVDRRVHQVATEFEINLEKVREQHHHGRDERSPGQCRRDLHAEDQSQSSANRHSTSGNVQSLRWTGSFGISIALLDDQRLQRSRCR